MEFLSNRQFAVRINNSITAKRIISAGVPQGAVLSPTLFSIFINDITISYFSQTICVIFKYTGKKEQVLNKFKFILIELRNG